MYHSEYINVYSGDDHMKTYILYISIYLDPNFIQILWNFHYIHRSLYLDLMYLKVVMICPDLKAYDSAYYSIYF